MVLKKFAIAACFFSAAFLICVLPAHAQLSDTYNANRIKADDFLQHLSGTCRNLYELTSGNRRREYPTDSERRRIRQAYSQFQEQCADEVLEAGEKMLESRTAKQREKMEAVKTKKEQDDKQQKIEARSREQCVESRRIIASKRARKDLTEGELQDLASFEEKVKQRCSLPSAPSVTTAAK